MRCAIYTRKSHAEVLEAGLDSLDQPRPTRDGFNGREQLWTPQVLEEIIEACGHGLIETGGARSCRINRT